MPAPERARGVLAATLFDHDADGGRGELAGLLADQIVNGHAQPQFVSHPTQHHRIAAPALAEPEILADHDMGQRERADEHAVHEGLGLHACHGSIEGQHEQQIDPVTFENPGLGGERRQTKGRGMLLEGPAGVRLEGDGAHRVALPGRHADQRLVAAMNPVEIAQRGGCAARRRRHFVETVDDPHSRRARPCRALGAHGSVELP